MMEFALKNLCRAFFILSCIIFPSFSYSANVVSVQSISIPPYNDAFKGLKSACSCDPKQLVLSEMQGYDVVKELRRERPAVIVAIGGGALEKIRAIKDVTVVYLMALDSQSVIAGRSNITGINMNIPPDRQLDLIRQALPEVNDIGLLYSAAQQGVFVDKAKIAAESAGIRLTAKEVGNSREVPDLLNLMTGIKAFWMLPDVGVVTPETVEMLFLNTLENRVPVITFSNKYLEMGALMSFEVDPYDMGVQAAEIVAGILSGTDADQIPEGNARKINVTVNARTAKKLGLKVSDDILNRARVINRD